MTFKYSKSTGAFYVEWLHGDNIPSDAVDVSAEEHARLMGAQGDGHTIMAGEDGAPISTPPPAPTASQLKASCEGALKRTADALARSWGYDSIISAASFATSSNATFKAEAEALVGYRDALWEWAPAVLDSMLAGSAAAPETVDEFISLAPAAPARPPAA